MGKAHFADDVQTMRLNITLGETYQNKYVQQTEKSSKAIVVRATKTWKQQAWQEMKTIQYQSKPAHASMSAKEWKLARKNTKALKEKMITKKDGLYIQDNLRM